MTYIFLFHSSVSIWLSSKLLPVLASTTILGSRPHRVHNHILSVLYFVLSEERTMTDVSMVVLQDYMDLEKAALGSCSETCPVSPHDADEAMDMKVEQVSGVEEGEDPLQITFRGINAELGVRCI
jgi:hypothetical protein